jgi:hypothetical protein
VSAGNASAIGVALLMTACAIQPRHAFAYGTTTHNIGNVTMSIVALLRIFGGSMAVDATRGY